MWARSLRSAARTSRWRALALRQRRDAATVTAHQLRDLVERLITAGQWSAGDPDILTVADA
jgi:hypothetical protein